MAFLELHARTRADLHSVFYLQLLVVECHLGYSRKFDKNVDLRIQPTLIANNFPVVEFYHFMSGVNQKKLKNL